MKSGCRGNCKLAICQLHLSKWLYLNAKREVASNQKKELVSDAEGRGAEEGPAFLYIKIFLCAVQIWHLSDALASSDFLAAYIVAFAPCSTKSPYLWSARYIYERGRAPRYSAEHLYLTAYPETYFVEVEMKTSIISRLEWSRRSSNALSTGNQTGASWDYEIKTGNTESCLAWKPHNETWIHTLA